MNLHEVYLAAQTASANDIPPEKVADMMSSYGIDSQTQIAEIQKESALNDLSLGYTRKNLFKNKAVTKLINGVTLTTNEDGTVTLNGTATANVFYTMNADFIVGDKPMILSGCPAGGSSNTYWLYILDGTETGTIAATDTGDGALFSKSEVKTGIGVVRIRIAKDTVLNNLVFKPMIRYAGITDDTYESYKPSIDERLSALESILASQAVNSVTQNLDEIPAEEKI